MSINNEQRNYDEATLIRVQSTTLTCLLNSTKKKKTCLLKLKELCQPNEENVTFTLCEI